MCNREILEVIIDEVGIKKAAEFCHLVSLMYDIKYNACKHEEPLTEYGFEKTWWADASEMLNKQVVEND